MFDSDRHVIEPSSLWRDYINVDLPKNTTINIFSHPPLSNGRVIQTLKVGNTPLYKNWGERLDNEFYTESADSLDHYLNAKTSDGQLESMSVGHIDVASLFPTAAMYVVNHSELPAKESRLYAQAYNQWLFDYCSLDPIRLNAVGVISRHEPKEMLAQLRVIHEEYHWKTVTLRPEVINGRVIGHQDYEPFWEAAEAMGVGIAFHGGTHLYGSTAGSERFSSRFALHACSHVMEAQMAFLSLLEEGVLERYPKLKIAFLETGASWIPAWLWRLDNLCYPEYTRLVKQHITMLPSEYFRRQCWVGIEVGEPCLRETANYIGHQHLLYGSDYPHLDHQHFDAKHLSQQLAEFSEQEKQDIFYNNAKSFYAHNKDQQKNGNA